MKRDVFDPEHPLTSGEYTKLYEEALVRDAAFDPTLKRVMELHAQYREANKPLLEIQKAIVEWIKNAPDNTEKHRRELFFHNSMTLTSMLATTYQWKEPELRSLLKPDDEEGRKRFAKSLISLGIDPAPFLGDVRMAEGAIDGLQAEIYRKLEKATGDTQAPAEWFNQPTYDLMINSSLEQHFKALSYRLATPRTKKFADAEYQMRVGGKLLRDWER